MDYKLAISSTGKNLDDMVDGFGSCRYFIIPNIENNTIKGYKSLPAADIRKSHIAGISTAQAIAKENPEAVIAAKIGQKSYEILDKANIDIYHASNTVESAIMDYIKGSLNNMTASAARGSGCGTGSGTGLGRGRRNK